MKDLVGIFAFIVLGLMPWFVGFSTILQHVRVVYVP